MGGPSHRLSPSYLPIAHTCKIASFSIAALSSIVTSTDNPTIRGIRGCVVTNLSLSRFSLRPGVSAFLPAASSCEDGGTHKSMGNDIGLECV